MEVAYLLWGQSRRAELKIQTDLLCDSRERNLKDVHVLFLNSPGVPVLLHTHTECHLFCSPQNQMVTVIVLDTRDLQVKLPRELIVNVCQAG